MKFPRSLIRSLFSRPRSAVPSEREQPIEASLTTARQRMIEVDLKGRGITDLRVLEAMGRIPRHEFVRPELARSAYDDSPLGIGYDQTISQPYMVASMTENLCVGEGSRVLEIGSGCGYQTAVLMEMGAKVFAVEINADLAGEASERLDRMGYRDFEMACRDGRGGWPARAPYDAILIAAAAESLPPALAEQLKVGGRIVAPIGRGRNQCLMMWTKNAGGPEGREVLAEHKLYPVRFVPLLMKG